MSEDVFSPGTIARRRAMRNTQVYKAIEIEEWKARCEERDAEIRRLRAREIVLMRQLRSRQDEIDALRRQGSGA
jgi:hypothetical protein